jgi:hypothetical protein
MANAQYIAGRQKYQRPQGILWSNNPGTLVLAPKADESDRDIYVYIPDGYEIGTDELLISDDSLADEFVILSDHNRSSIDFTPLRIETRQRMINGRMRSYHVADKLVLSTSWSMLPSRSYALRPNFDENGVATTPGLDYTADGGAGGAELLDWYNNHQGSFWVFLAYDNYPLFGSDKSAYGHLGQYNQVIEMYISDFNYSVKKRGGSNHDLWDIQVTLEEV